LETDRNKFNPSRLTVARKRHGLTKKGLAELLGVDVRSVLSYENGEVPANSIFIKMQEVLALPAEFFVGERLDLPDVEAVSFRSLKKMTARQRDMARAQAAFCVHLHAWFEAKFEMPVPSVPDLSKHFTPEAAAEALRRLWEIGEKPISNTIHLLEAKGVRVYSLAVDSREVDALSTWRDSIPYVFLNLQKTAEHSRFDAAHELGHLVLHRHGSRPSKDAEREADAFASAFLMPETSVLAEVPAFPTLHQIIRLKSKWGVSVAALNHRLHSLGITSDWHYRSLCIQLAKAGYRTNEPNGVPQETSRLLAMMLSGLYAEGVSQGTIARELGISVQFLNEMIFGLVMVGIEGGKQVGPSSQPAKLQLVKS
jgi:Zn-dependent peptidase ImmA (M78 family)/DNA-binding XRE family transcriptional regulator